MQTALPKMRPEGTIKNREMFGLEAAPNVAGVANSDTFSGNTTVSDRSDRDVLDGIEKVHMFDNAYDFVLFVTEMLQRRSNRLVNDF